MEHVVNRERFFDPEDIFFSVTDAKGVITRSNSTFVRLSAYPREQLIGAPHNIIRHDDMPAGVFKLMWDDLKNGLPVCAYVVNRANDEVDYRVFAVVVPVGDDFLSVRIKPQDGATRDLVEAVYQRVRDHERRVAAGGAGRREVGESGAVELAEAIAPFGFHSLLDMTEATLPTEVQLLLGAGVRVPDVPEATGPLSRILRVTRGVESDSNALVRQLDEYARLLASLDERASAMADMSQRAREVVVGISSVESLDPESSAPRTGERVTAGMRRATEVLTAVPRDMATLRGQVVTLRFLVSQMRLLTLVAGRFAASAVTGEEEDSLESMRLLCRALEEGTGRLAEAACAVRTGVAELDTTMRRLVRDLDGTQRPLSRWLRALRDEGAAALVEGVDCDEVLDRVGALADQGFPEAGGLALLAAECRGLELPFDKAVFDERFETFHEELETYASALAA